MSIDPVPLPKHWTEHIAPSGHVYYHHALTGESTYARPGIAFAVPAGSKIDPITGKLLVNQNITPAEETFTPNAHSPPKNKKERPLKKEAIDGTEWIRVITTHDNVFYFNRTSKKSTWFIPQELEQIEAARQLIEKERTSLKRKAQQEEDSKAQAEAAKQAELEAASKKPKKKKQKIVHSLADIEDVELKKSMMEQIEEENKRLEALERQDDNGSDVEMKEPVANAVDLTADEAKISYKAMLAEKNVNPMHPWDMELTKFVSDPRYTLVKLLKDRRALFDEYCKEAIRQQRLAKQAGSAPKVDPLTAYRQLLRTEVTSTRSHWDDFKLKYKKDNRFREFGRDDREREKAFKAWLKELGEVKRADAKRSEELFRAMLAEHQHDQILNQSWTEFKEKVSKDPRYEAIKSSSQREEIYNAFKASMKTASPTKDAETAKREARARREEALAARAAQVDQQKALMDKQAERSKYGANREEAEREFRSLLIDAIRSSNAVWEDQRVSLARDRRFNLPGLSETARRAIFQEHLENLSSKRLGVLEALFEQHAYQLDTPFDNVYEKIEADPAVARQGGRDKVESSYETWQRKRKARAREDLEALLKENSFVDFWGRMKKENDKQAARAGFEDKGDEEMAAADQVDVRQMSQNIDLAEINAVLKHDKRFQILSTMPQQRDAWIIDYLSNLTAHKKTIHQR